MELQLSPKEVRTKILQAEELMRQHPDAMEDDCCPLKHKFVDGAYVREIYMPAGMLLTSKIHKVKHPFFIMKGDVSVLNSEEGGAVRHKAPYWGITPANTKRILFIHEDTVWITVHITDSQDLEEIEKEIIAPSYKNILEHESVKKIGG